MSILFFLTTIAALGGLGYVAYLWWRASRQLEQTEADLRKHKQYAKQLKAEKERLAPYEGIADANEHATELRRKAQEELEAAQQEAAMKIVKAEQESKEAVSEARKKARETQDEAKARLDSATTQASQIIDDANRRAEEIAGKAYDVVRNSEIYEKTAKAMKNIIDGYGDRYVIPSRSLLDDLADDFSHTDAGRNLKTARDQTKAMVTNGTAAACDYVEANRRDTAINFVTDAFNGKVDSILSRVKHDNAGTLEQEIRDAFNLVNYNGSAFRNARITQEYLASRLNELKWAAVAEEIKLQEREEQRRIKEQMREEAKARREYEKAMRDAAKEEDMLRKAMEKAQKQVADATEEQRAKFEEQLRELEAKLQEAEEKNKRAISMAQQTRQGHVYIISNIGSFGEDVFKIGLTRRLEPLDRVKELGDSSVPFEFDVHALIWAEDAPALENQLHRHFALMQVNKVNHRKEFFRAGIQEIRGEVEKLGLKAKWTLTAEAREFKESQAIEKVIQDDPAAREAWLNRQLELEPVGVGIVGDDEGS